LTASRRKQPLTNWRFPPTYHLYTDGSASHITKDGGWAFIIQSDEGLVAQDAGHVPNTTNNAMEIYAAVQGLKFFNTVSDVKVYSDSAYVVNTMNNKWWVDWEKNNWIKHTGATTPNKDYWQELLSLIKKHDVEFIKVQGHSGDTLNERCDRLAKEARKYGTGFDWKRDFSVYYL